MFDILLLEKGLKRLIARVKFLLIDYLINQQLLIVRQRGGKSQSKSEHNSL